MAMSSDREKEQLERDRVLFQIKIDALDYVQKNLNEIVQMNALISKMMGWMRALQSSNEGLKSFDVNGRSAVHLFRRALTLAQSPLSVSGRQGRSERFIAAMREQNSEQFGQWVAEYERALKSKARHERNIEILKKLLEPSGSSELKDLSHDELLERGAQYEETLHQSPELEALIQHIEAKDFKPMRQKETQESVARAEKQFMFLTENRKAGSMTQLTSSASIASPKVIEKVKQTLFNEVQNIIKDYPDINRRTEPDKEKSPLVKRAGDQVGDLADFLGEISKKDCSITHERLLIKLNQLKKSSDQLPKKRKPIAWLKSKMGFFSKKSLPLWDINRVIEVVKAEQRAVHLPKVKMTMKGGSSPAA